MTAWASLHDLREIVITVGVLAGAVVSVGAAARLPVVSRPLRWIGRTLVGDPASRAIHGALDAWADQDGGINSRLGEIEYQLRPNGGKSLRDRVDAIANATDARKEPA